MRRKRLGWAAYTLFIAVSILGMSAMAGAQSDKSWSEPQTLGSAPSGGGASIAASGPNVYVAWGNGPVYLRRSTDSGLTFSPPQQISSFGVIHETDSLAAEGNDVFAITFARTSPRRDWCCDRELGDLVLHRSTDAGATWKSKPLSSSGAAFRVSIAAALPYIHVVWSDFRGG